MILFIVIHIFIASVTTSDVKLAETMDINLETTLLFDPKDTNSDLTLITKIRKFLDTIEAVIEKKNKARQMEEKSKRNGPREDKKVNRRVFTKFLEDLGNTLLKFNGDEIQNITKILKNQLSNLYEAKTSKKDEFPTEAVYDKLLSDPKTKSYINSYIKKWISQDAETLKAEIKKSIKNKSHDVVAKLVKKLNILYNDQDDKIFKKIVKIISHFPRRHMDLSSVIYKGLKYIVFDRKTENRGKDKLLKYVDKVVTYLSKDPHGLKESRKHSINDVFPSLKKSEEGGKTFIYTNKNITNTSIEKITKITDEEDTLPNEIIINEKIQIDLAKTTKTAKTVVNRAETTTLEKPTPTATQKPVTTNQPSKVQPETRHFTTSKKPTYNNTTENTKATNNTEKTKREEVDKNNENTIFVSDEQANNTQNLDELFLVTQKDEHYNETENTNKIL